MTCVLDASTVLKTAVTEQVEEDAGAARAVLPRLAETFGFQAPTLLAWEVGNVVHAREPDRFGTTPEARQAYVDLLLSGIDLVPPREGGWSRIGQLCQEHDLTAYDASYLALALDDPDPLLVTDDARLLEAGRSTLGVDRAHDAVSAFDYVQDGLL